MKSELDLSLKPLPFQQHLNLVPNELYNQFRTLKSFTEQVKFYNNSICSLATRNMAGDLAINSESGEWFVIYSGAQAYRNSSFFKTENEKEFFRKREQEVNRIIRLLKKLTSYEEKLIALIQIKGFDLNNLKVFANLPYAGEQNPDKQFLLTDPVVDLNPTTPDEISSYNRIIEQRFQAFNFDNISTNGRFQVFNFVDQKTWFEAAERPSSYAKSLM